MAPPSAATPPSLPTSIPGQPLYEPPRSTPYTVVKTINGATYETVIDPTVYVPQDTLFYESFYNPQNRLCEWEGEWGQFGSDALAREQLVSGTYCDSTNYVTWEAAMNSSGGSGNIVYPNYGGWTPSFAAGTALGMDSFDCMETDWPVNNGQWTCEQWTVLS